MPREGVTIYDLLISCPGDVTGYLQLIKEAVDNFNKLYGSLNNIQVSIKHWSTDSFPESGDKPQELLNKQIVRECDAAVAIFWTRFGTATDNYGSGTEEEIEEMLSADKQVFMYFLEAPIIPSNIDIKQYEKVQEFKERYKDRGIFFIVKDEIDFQRLFTNHLSITDKKTLSDENILPKQFSLLESKFINEKQSKINEYIDELNSTVISEEADILEDKSKMLTMPSKEDASVDFLYQIADSVAISDKFKYTINDFAKENQIKLHENFWYLGNLMKHKLQVQIPFGNSGPSYIGSDKEKKRFSKLNKLYWEIISYKEYIEYFTYIDNIKFVELIVSNLGKTYDEDIDIKLMVPKGCLLKHNNLLYPGENIIEEIQGIELDEFLFKIKESDSVDAYAYFQIIPSNIERININPLIAYTTRPGYEDQKYNYKNSLEHIFIYKNFTNSEFDILRFGIEYLKHNSSMAFPSILMFENVPQTVEYEITSKHIPDVVKGKIHLKID